MGGLTRREVPRWRSQKMGGFRSCGRIRELLRPATKRLDVGALPTKCVSAQFGFRIGWDWRLTALTQAKFTHGLELGPYRELLSTDLRLVGRIGISPRKRTTSLLRRRARRPRSTEDT
jgi:hypothetical protein